VTAVVTQREANLVRLARAVVRPEGSPELARLLAEGLETPDVLGPTATRLLSEALSEGVVLGLARRGGWRREGAVRLWEASPPALRFTGNTVRLLQWLLATRLGSADVAPLVLEGALTEAEECLVVLLLDRVRTTLSVPVLWREPALRASPLVVLAFAAELARVVPLAEVPALRASHVPYLWGLSRLLESSWSKAERDKRAVERLEVLQRTGEAQEAAWRGFLAMVDAAGARGLATTLIRVGAEFLAVPRRVEDLAGGLSSAGRLRERSMATRSAASLMRTLVALRAWDAEHRAWRFIDEGYDEAQRLIREWEVLGDAGFRAAEALAAQCEALVQAQS